MIPALLDALTPIAIFGIIFGTVLGFRYMKHQETVKMIEHGYTPEMLRAPEHGPSPDPRYLPAIAPQRTAPGRAQLIWGCVLAGIGLALTLALWPLGFVINRTAGVAFPFGIGPWMVAGFIPLFVGLTLILAYVFVQPEREMPAREMAPPSIPMLPQSPYHSESFTPPESAPFSSPPPERHRG